MSLMKRMAKMVEKDLGMKKKANNEEMTKEQIEEEISWLEDQWNQLSAEETVYGDNYMLYGGAAEEEAREVLNGYRQAIKKIDKRLEFLQEKLKQFN